MKKIVEGVYGNLVKPASPTGLLPQWDQFVDQAVVGQKGFAFDTAKAKQMLADAGYKDTNGDGLVENKDGSKIALKLIVPAGWTDWMEAIRVIATGAKAARHQRRGRVPRLQRPGRGPQLGQVRPGHQQRAAAVELAVHLLRVHLPAPVQAQQNTVNFARYENEQAWKLVQQLDSTKTDDVEGMKKVSSQLEGIMLDEMPVIPLWYNGLWSQVSSSVWKNWPSSEGSAPKSAPTMWRNWLELGGFESLAALQPVAP